MKKRFSRNHSAMRSILPLALLLVSLAFFADAAERKPNFVLVLVDDMGRDLADRAHRLIDREGQVVRAEPVARRNG